MRNKAGDALYVEWVDSHQIGRSVWTSIDEIATSDLETIHSVGFFVHESCDYLSIACSRASNDVQGNITIPKCAIVTRRRVTVPWKKGSKPV